MQQRLLNLPVNLHISPRSVQQYWPWLIGLACALLAILILLALTVGAVAIEPASLWQWLQARIRGLAVQDSQTQLIVESLRLPRALLAAGVGALLAICGAAAQGLFRNPLADPALIGVSAGAAAGASLVIVFLGNTLVAGWFGVPLISLGAFAGAIVVVVAVYRLATDRRGGATSVATMLLAGVAFSYLAGSLSNVLKFISNNDQLRQLSLWHMGGLEAANFTQVALVASVLALVGVSLYRQHKALNALLLGESEARHLGINVKRVKSRIIVCIAAGVGVAVALSGVVAFIGLVVPHIVRMLLGPNHKYLLPMSACVGAMLLVLADTLARTLIAPTELPVGLMTAVLGAPVFISLLRHRKNYQ
ncbi:FecCD family ABC transporter permease [Marinagarivorans algicola]|uniref:FecCD family ABC transporter permease n=1 Tax=Marinagarivorans algicola TaxID=1513270 RepID=UPI003736D999